MTESIAFRSLPVAGATLLQVRDSQRLWTYAHEKFCVTSVVSGTGRWTMRGSHYDISPASLMVMEPGDVHVTTAVSHAASFDAWFVEPALLEGLFSDSLRDRRLPRLAAAPSEPGTLDAFRALAATAAHDPMAAEEQLTAAFARMFRASDDSALRLGPRCEKRVEQAREVIADSYQREPFTPVDIREVADALAVDYFWLLRRFREHFQLTPYQYAKHLRAARARELLIAGPSGDVPTLEIVASRAGFYDYGHMIRDLKRCLGVPPAEVARQLGSWQPRRR